MSDATTDRQIHLRARYGIQVEGSHVWIERFELIEGRMNVWLSVKSPAPVAILNPIHVDGVKPTT